MSVENHEQYVTSKVMTASSHQLHLMLIDGAIRNGRQADELLRGNNALAATAPLMRTLEIIGEMLAGVRRVEGKLNKQIESLYLFIYRCAAEAKINSDREKLAEAMKLLVYERETWRMACDKVAAEE